VLSSGLKEMKDVDEYLLSRNRLTDKGFNEVLSSINQDVVKLDFSNNKILSINTDLMKLLTNIDSRLQHLNLENNKLGDTAMASLSLAASCSRSLRYLNIRRNFLTRQSCENLSMVVEKAKHLEELYLGWVIFAFKSE
jgi:Ran GTPase-activating protein (RanGAP) involved in mRNA processing and transport